MKQITQKRALQLITGGTAGFYCIYAKKVHPRRDLNCVFTQSQWYLVPRSELQIDPVGDQPNGYFEQDTGDPEGRVLCGDAHIVTADSDTPIGKLLLADQKQFLVSFEESQRRIQALEKMMEGAKFVD